MFTVGGSQRHMISFPMVIQRLKELIFKYFINKI